MKTDLVAFEKEYNLWWEPCCLPEGISYYKESVVRLLDYYVPYFLLSNDYVQLDNDIGVEMKLMLSNLWMSYCSWHGWIHVAWIVQVFFVVSLMISPQNVVDRFHAEEGLYFELKKKKCLWKYLSLHDSFGKS